MRILILDKDEARTNSFKQKLLEHELFPVKSASEAIKVLEKHKTFDQLFLDQEFNEEVALWISEHDSKRPYRIVIHGFSVPYAQNILTILPQASFLPGVWLLDRMEF
jgi:hypothetical protein